MFDVPSSDIAQRQASRGRRRSGRKGAAALMLARPYCRRAGTADLNRTFEAAICADGKAVEANLRGFHAGYATTAPGSQLPGEAPKRQHAPSPELADLECEIERMPAAAQAVMAEGVRRPGRLSGPRPCAALADAIGAHRAQPFDAERTQRLLGAEPGRHAGAIGAARGQILLAGRRCVAVLHDGENAVTFVEHVGGDAGDQPVVPEAAVAHHRDRTLGHVRSDGRRRLRATYRSRGLNCRTRTARKSRTNGSRYRR